MRKISLSLTLIILVFLLSGCSYNISIDDYYFINAIGIDYINDELINLSIQVPKVSNNDSGSSQSSSFKIYSAQAQTINQAISILNNYLNKQINFSHCSAVIVSEELAKKGIRTYMNTINNNNEIRYNCQLIVSSGTAYEILENISNSGEAYSARLFDYLKHSKEYTGYTANASFNDFCSNLNNDVKDPIGIYVSASNSNLEITGIAVFKGEYMVGKLDVIDSISHLLVSNELESCSISLNHPNNIDMEVKMYKNTEIDVSYINNSPFIEINIYPEANILYSEKDFDYSNEYNIGKAETLLNNYLEKNIYEYLYKITREYDADIVSFKEFFQTNFLTEDSIEKFHWENNFKNAFFEVNIHSRVLYSNITRKE